MRHHLRRCHALADKLVDYRLISCRSRLWRRGYRLPCRIRKPCREVTGASTNSKDYQQHNYYRASIHTGHFTLLLYY